MINNFKKLLVFGALFVTGSLALTGCLTHGEGGKTPSDEEGEGQGGQGEGGGQQGGETPTTTFPAEALKSFLTSEGVSVTVPSPVSSGEWTYKVNEDEEYGNSFSASVEDKGTIGTDSIEDTYTALLQKTSGWIVNDDYYDFYGYLAYKDNVALCYYTEEGTFYFEAYKYEEEETDYQESATFPATQLQAFLTGEGLKTTVPSATGGSTWYYASLSDEDGNYFEIKTADSGTLGKDAIEDTYKATLQSTGGWKIDDTYYEEYGYYANKGDVEIQFYSYEEEFIMYVYAGEESGEGGDPTPTPTPTDGEWTLVTDASDLTAGDVIVIGESSKSVVLAGDIEGGSNKYFNKEDATFSNGVIASLPSKATTFTLGKNGNYWTLTSDGSLLGATDNKKIAWDTGTTDWSISIASDGNATIQNKTEGYGRILYNSGSPRFTSYTNSLSNTMLLPEIYKLSGEGGDPTPTPTPEPKEKAEWTIMIYMCGADLESGTDEDGNTHTKQAGYASLDIDEILSISNQPDDVNIIIETGGAKAWANSKIKADELGRWHIENKQLVKDASITKASMGLQSTFESFLNWGLTYYPAEKTGVILWNHGGALSGCCYDENYNDDCLTPKEVSSAFAEVLEDQKLEFIGYDCCLMQVQDIADLNSPYFNYMVAAEESEAGEGWAYDTWVDDLYAKKSTENILKAVCDGFVSSYSQSYPQYANDQTLSVLDLSKMAAYREAFEALGASIKDVVKNSKFNTLVKSVKHYADSWMDEDYYNYYIDDLNYDPEMFISEVEDGETYYCLLGYYIYASFDVKDFLNKLKADSTLGLSSAQKTNVQNALDKLSELVIYNVAGDEAGESYGLAMICPIDTWTANNAYPSSATNFTTWRSAVTASGRSY